MLHAALLLLSSLLLQAEAPPPHGYAPPEDLPATLTALAAEGDAELVEYGRSPEGRPLLALTFGRSTAPGRPEVLLVGNLDGARLGATEVLVGLCRRLAESGSPLLDAATVHVVPLANPDAAVRAFRGADPWRGGPVDEDHDGLVDEDGPTDLDGDGLALWLKVPDPVGRWRTDDRDPRALVEADAASGEAGGFRRLREGDDHDGDREYGEDPPGGEYLDANFPHRWPQYQPEGGPYPLSAPEARALADFVLAHRHLALVVVLDDDDAFEEVPKGAERVDRDATRPMEDDREVLVVWSKRFRDLRDTEAGEDRPKLPAPRGGADERGRFGEWAYFQAGVPVIESALWSPPLDRAPESAPDLGKDAPDELKLLRWNDVAYDGAGFRDWRPLDHPSLGPVEVGGWLPLVLDNPPASDLPRLTALWGDFLDGLAGDFASLEWVDVETTPLGSGVFETRATLVNRGLLATTSAMGVRSRRPLPVRVVLELPQGGELLAGRRLQSVERLDGLGGHREFRWVYRLPDSGAAALRATSQCAGEAVAELEVER